MSIRMMSFVAALGLAVAPALADDHGDKKATTTPGEATTTEKIGEQVPTMKNDAEPAKDSKAPDSQTYTDKVGESVPDMKAPEKKD